MKIAHFVITSNIRFPKLGIHRLSSVYARTDRRHVLIYPQRKNYLIRFSMFILYYRDSIIISHYADKLKTHIKSSLKLITPIKVLLKSR